MFSVLIYETIILFSPGIDNNCAKRLLEKLKRCASKYFGSWFEFVKYREMLKRTKNAYIYNYLVEIGKAIKRSRTVSFRYRKNGRLTDKVFKVSPYFLIISGGWYYLICNTDGRDALSHYRIDRMEQVEMNFERGRDFYSVESVDEFFEISKYLEEHPRMSYEEPVSATLLVDETLVEAVELPQHPHYVGVQYHPEFKSRPTHAHPLFRELIRAALEK